MDYVALVSGPSMREREKRERDIGKEGERWNEVKLFAKNILNCSLQASMT